MGIMRRAVKRVLRVVSGSGGPPPSAPARAPTQTPPVDSGSELANIECGGQELKERLEAGESPVIIDVRQPHETAAGIIENALLIPLGELESRWEELKDADEIVCYCALGGRSLQAAGFLRSKGLFNATSMDGGMVGWQGIGGAVVTPASK